MKLSRNNLHLIQQLLCNKLRNKYSEKINELKIKKQNYVRNRTESYKISDRAKELIAESREICKKLTEIYARQTELTKQLEENGINHRTLCPVVDLSNDKTYKKFIEDIAVLEQKYNKANSDVDDIILALTLAEPKEYKNIFNKLDLTTELPEL